MPIRSGHCVDGWHEKCDLPGCYCECHDVEKAAREIKAALAELVRAADPEINMSDILLLEALSRAREALEMKGADEVGKDIK